MVTPSIMSMKLTDIRGLPEKALAHLLFDSFVNCPVRLVCLVNTHVANYRVVGFAAVQRRVTVPAIHAAAPSLVIHSGPNPLAILSGTVNVRPHRPHRPSCHTATLRG